MNVVKIDRATTKANFYNEYEYMGKKASLEKYKANGTNL